MLVCQLWCSTNYQVVGNNVVKCDLDTGLWTSSMPTCEAERLVVDTSANVGGKESVETVYHRLIIDFYFWLS